MAKTTAGCKKRELEMSRSDLLISRTQFHASNPFGDLRNETVQSSGNLVQMLKFLSVLIHKRLYD